MRGTARSRRWADSLLSDNPERVPPSYPLPSASDYAGLEQVAASIVREGTVLLAVPRGEVRASLIRFRRGDAVFEGLSEGELIAGAASARMRQRVPDSDLQPPFAMLVKGLRSIALNVNCDS